MVVTAHEQAADLTEAQRRALLALMPTAQIDKHGNIRAMRPAELGKRMQEAKQGRRLDARGAGFLGGTMLSRLRKKGLVDHYDVRGEMGLSYRLTAEGLAVAELVVANPDAPARRKSSGTIETDAVSLAAAELPAGVVVETPHPEAVVVTADAVVLNSDIDGGLTVFVPEGVKLSAIRDGLGSGDCKVRGAGDGDASRDGQGPGNAVREGDGDGNARRAGSGSGDARRLGDGDGDAYVSTHGAGNAIRKGVGEGEAVRSSYGAGNAVRDGPGDGIASRVGEGPGNALRSGSGKGHAWRFGDGAGDAVRTGEGPGRAECGGAGPGDAVREGQGEGDAVRWGEGSGFAVRNDDGPGKAVDRKHRSGRRLDETGLNEPGLEEDDLGENDLGEDDEAGAALAM